MTAYKMIPPGPVAAGAGGSEGVRMSRLNDLQNKDLPLLLQVSQLQQRFGLTEHRARLLARLVYGEGDAA